MAVFLDYLKSIGRSDVADIITVDTPWVFFTQELYRAVAYGIKGGGGLGVLAGDVTRIAEDIGMPLVMVTPYYSSQNHQVLTGFKHGEINISVKPDDYGFNKLSEVSIRTSSDDNVKLGAYVHRHKSVRVLAIYEPNIGQLYYGEPNSDHRLYQEIANGFGGYQALKLLSVSPAVLHVNEAPAIFAAIAMLDSLCDGGMDFNKALSQVRQRTIFTNHTLMPAAEGNFSRDQFGHFVTPNIKSQAVIDWLWSQFNGDSIRLSQIAFELAGKYTGVSKLHAKLSSERYKKSNGDAVNFAPITNGISEHWICDDFLKLYQKSGIVDGLGLPTFNYDEALNKLDINMIRAQKYAARKKSNEILKTRKDQYGQPIYIPETSKVFDFKRRFVKYKRPEMMFTDTSRLADILDRHDAHLVFAGKPHSDDTTMVEKLSSIFESIDSNPILRKRVHYVQDYDEEVGLALAIGSDCAINVPTVGDEACGTSWMKDIANFKVLISTTDGGVADIKPATYLEVSGQTYDQEVDCLYRQMEKALEIIADDNLFRAQVIQQLVAYLPTISGARMIRDYIDLAT